MKILVTGGGGFLGSRIAEMLFAEGHDVTIFNRKRYAEIEQLGIKGIIGDITDYQQVCDALKGMDAVIHTAAFAEMVGDKKKFYDINVRGTKHIAEACLMENVSKLVFTSSPSVVIGGEDIENGNEELPYPVKWLSEYPRTKALAEQYVLASNGRQMMNGEKLMTCALRPHMIWGPRDTHIIPRILEAAKKGRLSIVGDGTNKIDMTYIDNAAQAHIDALNSLNEESATNGNAYFIGDAEPVAMWEWLNKLLQLLGEKPITKKKSAKVVSFAGFVFEKLWSLFRLSGYPPMTRFIAMQLSTSHWFSHKKAQQDFGYNPTVASEQGMEKLVAWLKNMK